MASCSAKRVKLHQIGVKVVTEVEAIIFYLVLSKGSNKNAQKMWEITFKERYELPVGFDLPLARVSCILPPVSLYSLMCPHSSALIHSASPIPQGRAKRSSPFLEGKGMEKCFCFGFGMSDRGLCAFCGVGGCGQALHLYK